MLRSYRRTVLTAKRSFKSSILILWESGFQSSQQLDSSNFNPWKCFPGYRPQLPVVRRGRGRWQPQRGRSTRVQPLAVPRHQPQVLRHRRRTRVASELPTPAKRHHEQDRQSQLGQSWHLTRRRQIVSCHHFFSKYLLVASISEVKIPYKSHSNKWLNQGQNSHLKLINIIVMEDEIFIGAGAWTRDFTLRCCEPLFCLALSGWSEIQRPW